MFKRIVAAILAPGLLSACAPQQAPVTMPTLSPYFQELLEQDLKRDLTDKQREVLSDGWVTDEEWIEISNDFHNCLEPTQTEAELGTISLSYRPTSERQSEINRMFNQDSDLVSEQLDKDLALMDACATTSIIPVGMYYFEPRNNPDGVSPDQAILRCFQENGITDLDTIPDAELIDYIFSGKYNFHSSPERLRCVVDPAYGELALHED